MAEFRVWAPQARRVVCQLDSQRRPMEREGDRGWWRLEAEAAAGALYAYLLDDDDRALPDPRSASQPEGVHGRSQIIDHAAFEWNDHGFVATALADAVIYEMHVGCFTPEGTFDAAIERLPHLIELGVTHLELMPVAEFAGTRGWGYDSVDLFAPHHAYGGTNGLKRLVNACHARGIAVLLDIVYNHFGPSGNYLSRFGPYLTDFYATPWGSAVNLDGRGSDEVRAFSCDNAVAWMRDYHLDGLRLDAVHAMFDRSPTHLLEELAQRTAALARESGRRLVLIGEDDRNDPRVVRPSSDGGYGVDAVWSEDFHHAIHALLTGERSGYYADFGSLGNLAKALRHGYSYDGQYSRYRDRRHGRSTAGLTGHNFVGCVQNHDQVGNRARGDRLCHLLSPARIRIAAALLLTSPFVPMLFAGEEWAASSPFQYFTDYQEPELGRAVSDGRKREFAAFGWDPAEIPDPQDPATFERSRLNWAELDHEPHRGVLRWYRDLLRMRARTPELRDGRLDNVDVAFAENERWLMMTRGSITVAFNLGAMSRQLPVPGTQSRRLLMTSHDEARLDAAGLYLPPESVAIIGTGG